MSYRSICGALALMSGWWIGPAVAENRIALVIGNSTYETVTVLPNPANDAKAMTDLLKSAGFEVVSAPNLSHSEMRQTISNFAGKVAAKGRDTVALVFYAGHGLQVDGENFLVPIDARIQREADVPLQAMRLADVMNALLDGAEQDAHRHSSTPAATIRFPRSTRASGRGLAIVDAPTGSLVSYSTAPGTEAQDGDGANSSLHGGAVQDRRKPGVPIEQALKRVRPGASGDQYAADAVGKLVADRRLLLLPGAGPDRAGRLRRRRRPGAARRADRRRREAARRSSRGARSFARASRAEAYEMVIRRTRWRPSRPTSRSVRHAIDAPRVRGCSNGGSEMIAWYTAVTINTAASFEAFLASYPNSDSPRRRGGCWSARATARSPASRRCADAVPVLGRRRRRLREKKAKTPKKEKQATPEPRKRRPRAARISSATKRSEAARRRVRSVVAAAGCRSRSASASGAADGRPRGPTASVGGPALERPNVRAHR